MNQVLLVGRVTDIKQNDKNVSLLLAVARNFKNPDGEYEKDYIPCSLWHGIADNFLEYCKENDIVGIRGCIQNKEDGSIEVIAEKITFLSSKSENENSD